MYYEIFKNNYKNKTCKISPKKDVFSQLKKSDFWLLKKSSEKSLKSSLKTIFFHTCLSEKILSEIPNPKDDKYDIHIKKRRQFFPLFKFLSLELSKKAPYLQFTSLSFMKIKKTEEKNLLEICIWSPLSLQAHVIKKKPIEFCMRDLHQPVLRRWRWPFNHDLRDRISLHYALLWQDMYISPLKGHKIPHGARLYL